MYQTSAHITTLNNSARESEEFLPSTVETLERRTPFTVFRGVVGPYTGTLLPFWGLQRHSNKSRHCTHKNDLSFVIKTHWNVFDKNAGLSTPASPGRRKSGCLPRHRGQFQISLPGSMSRKAHMPPHADLAWYPQCVSSTVMVPQAKRPQP